MKKDKIVTEYLNNIQEIEPFTLMVAAAAFGFINAINLTYQTYSKYLSKNARRCSGLPPREKTVCMMGLKILGKKNQLKQLQTTLQSCPKSKKPEKCRTKVSGKINEVKQDIQSFSKRLPVLKKQRG